MMLTCSTAQAGPKLGRVQAVWGAPIEVEVVGNALAADGLQELSAWVEAFRITQVGLALQTGVLCVCSFCTMAHCFEVHASVNHTYMQQFIGRLKVWKGAGGVGSIEVGVAGAALAADGLQELSAWVEAFRITQVGLACSSLKKRVLCDISCQHNQYKRVSVLLGCMLALIVMHMRQCAGRPKVRKGCRRCWGIRLRLKLLALLL
jgi:hypothetical protein